MDRKPVTRGELLRAWDMAKRVLRHPEAPQELREQAKHVKDVTEVALGLMDADRRAAEKAAQAVSAPSTDPTI